MWDAGALRVSGLQAAMQVAGRKAGAHQRVHWNSSSTNRLWWCLSLRLADSKAKEAGCPQL